MNEQNPIQALHERAARDILAASTDDALQAIAVQQQLGTGEHALMARIAVTAHQQHGWRTLLILPTPTLMHHALTEYERLGEGKGAGYGHGWRLEDGADFVVTTKHVTRGMRLSAEVGPDYFELVIFGSTVIWSLEAIKRTACAFSGARLHLLWGAYNKLALLPIGAPITDAEWIKYIALLRWPDFIASN
jgi:hypothetical protein